MKSFFFPAGGFGANCYLVLDGKLENAVLIDPTVPPSDVVSALGYLPRIAAILLTHSHADHLIFLSEWKAETGAPVAIGLLDEEGLRNPQANCSWLLGMGERFYGHADRCLKDGDSVSFGDSVLSVIATPGHTAGSVSYFGEDTVYTGDTLFADGGIGRTDFYGGSEEMIYASVARLMQLPGNTTVYPGHGRKTNITTEKRFHNI